MAKSLVPSVLVLDSWPVLEWLKGREPAASKFRVWILESAGGRLRFEMSRINYGEVVYTIRKAPDILDREKALREFLALGVILHSVDDGLVDDAIDLKSIYSFSYADAFAAALAVRLQTPLLTGDAEFLTLQRDGVLLLEWMGK